MRRVAVLALALASCVPSGEESDPRGSLGVVTMPSPGSRGEPFVTTDGWTVRVEHLILQVSIVGSAIDPNADLFTGKLVRETSVQGPYLVRGSSPETYAAPGLPTGPGTVRLPFSRLELGTRMTTEPHETEARGVPPELVARFLQRPDSLDLAYDIPRPPEFGPSILLVARGEKDGRLVTLDFTFNGAFRPFDDTPLEIRRNTRNESRRSLVAESLFSGFAGYVIDCSRGESGDLEPKTPTKSFHSGLVFGDLASADVDGDGKLSAAELRAPSIVPRCECCSEANEDSWRYYTTSMAALLQDRSAELFQPEGAGSR